MNEVDKIIRSRLKDLIRRYLDGKEKTRDIRLFCIRYDISPQEVSRIMDQINKEKLL